MANHSSVLARKPMDRGARQATIHGVSESDMTEHTPSPSPICYFVTLSSSSDNLCFYVLVIFCPWNLEGIQLSSVAQLSPTLRPHESQHTRPPCPSLTPRAYSNSCPSSQWCHSAISSSVVPFSSCPQSLPASGSFPMSQLFAWGGQSIGVSASASVPPMNTQDVSSSGWTGWIFLQCFGEHFGSTYFQPLKKFFTWT